LRAITSNLNTDAWWRNPAGILSDFDDGSDAAGGIKAAVLVGARTMASYATTTRGERRFRQRQFRLVDARIRNPLVYEKKPDGAFKLNGVEFLVPISAWTAAEPPRIMGQALKKADRLGIWYLHVWTWEPSPSALFADWNPNVKCGGVSSKHH
jgi:hypothetical protein